MDMSRLLSWSTGQVPGVAAHGGACRGEQPINVEPQVGFLRDRPRPARPGSPGWSWPGLLVRAASRRPLRAGPDAGGGGIGDPYFPRDGNGGIDVLHYDVRDRYDFGSGRLAGRTRLASAPRRTCPASTSTSCCRSDR